MFGDNNREEVGLRYERKGGYRRSFRCNGFEVRGAEITSSKGENGITLGE